MMSRGFITVYGLGQTFMATQGFGGVSAYSHTVNWIEYPGAPAVFTEVAEQPTSWGETEEKAASYTETPEAAATWTEETTPGGDWQEGPF